MQGEQGARLRRDDLLPIPLIDVDGVQIIQLLVAADGVHVGVNALAGVDVVAIERHALPLGQRMDDLRVGVRAGNIETDRALHAVEIIVQAGGRLDEKRRGHAAQIQFAGERILKHALNQADGALRFIQRKVRRIARGNKRLTHRKSPF